MPTFTMEVFRVIELGEISGLTEAQSCGLESFPIYDEAKRPELTKKIIEHYWTREIGIETVDAWRFAMRRRMNEIMPLYNDLYRSAQIQFDPLNTIDITTLSTSASETHSTAEAEGVSQSDTLSKARVVSSNTPQVMLRGDGDYASGATDTISDADTSATNAETNAADSESSGTSESHTKGYQGHAASLLRAYRESLLNIDLLIIDELADLFMGVWDTDEDYLPYPFTPLPLTNF